MKRTTIIAGMPVIFTPILTGVVWCSPTLESCLRTPTSIVVTKTLASDPKVQSVYTLTGEKMQAVYQALESDARHTIPRDATFNCPSFSSQMMVWNYHLVIHYADNKTQSFTQTDVGCVFVTDDATGASALGALPSMDPFYPQTSEILHNAAPDDHGGR
jgi:hypothetical protein